MGRTKLNHVQYKRNIHPDFVDKMDKHLNKLKEKNQSLFLNTSVRSSILFATLESSDGESVLKQHGYTDAMRGAWHSEKYKGNKQLCNKKGGIHDGDKFISMEEIDPEELDRNNCCKRCLMIYDSLV